ncbi:MAG: IPT/TIG domain-containing protein, partial [Lutibacter sp.]
SGPSAEQTFSVSGTLLTTDITLTAPTNFEISTTSGSGFGSSVTLPQSGGTVNATTIYTRLKSALAINSYTGDLTAASTGATTQSITFYGDVLCNPTQTITSFVPTSGPVGTSVTITGTGFTASSTVDFNGVSATVTYVNATTLVAIVPAGAVTGVITVTEAGCGIDSATNFIVLEDNGCVGGTIPAGYTDLMFTGIYDDPISSCHYFELLNPTLSDIDLSTYSIGFDNNFTYGSAVPTSGFTGGVIALSGIIAAQTTVMVQVSSSGVCNTCSTIIPDLTFANGGINKDDRLVLLNGSTAVDVWQNNSARPGYTTDFDKGYIYSRLSTATAPSTTFNINDWNANGLEDCFGFSLSSAVLPTIGTQPTDVSGCGTSASFTVSASPGNSGALTYQWKYNDGTATGWSNVTSSSFAGNNSGFTNTNLIINGFNLDGYQFYCEVTESGSCTVMSNAAQVNTQTTTWNGTWSNGAPNLTTTAVINGNYNTSTNGNFSACSLFVNAGFNITIDNYNFVEVENDAFIDGTIVVETKGAFVQNSDSGVFTVHTGGSSSVNKTTAYLNNWYDYTDWSSPVIGETVENALSIAPASRRFYFNATNFVDMLEEVGNTGTFLNNPGVDDIDDNGDDWQLATGVMTPGVGYTSTVNSSGFSAGSYTTSFNGPFNNGVITTPIVNNSGGLYNDWNFIGNP